MAANKKSFILYCDQKGLWDKLTDDQAGKLIKHIISYVNDENPTAPDFITELAFEPIKQSLKRDLQKWETQYEQRVEAGRKSAEARKRNATSVNGRSVSSTVSVSVSGSVSDNVKESEGAALDVLKAEMFSDQRWAELIAMNHKGKNIDRAWSECYTHHMSSPTHPKEVWLWRQKLSTWLTMVKDEKPKSKFINKPKI